MKFPALKKHAITTIMAVFVLMTASSASGQFGFGSRFVKSTKDPGPINAPTSVTATTLSSTQIRVDWTDASSNETWFRVERSPDGSSGWTLLATLVGNTVTYTDSSGLIDGTRYYYRVYGINGPLAQSPYSNIASATTTMNAPTSLAVSGSSTSSVILTWVDQSQSETGYEVYRSPNNSSWTLDGTTGAGATSYTVNNLVDGSRYYFYVRGKNGLTVSANSNTVNQITTMNAPYGLWTSTQSSSLINIYWSDASSTETSYTVLRSPDGWSWSVIATLSANATSYSNSGLVDGTRYYYTVYASNALTISGNANSASAVTIMNGPTNFNVSVGSSFYIDLSWTDASSSETGYEVWRSTDNANWSLVATTGAGAGFYRSNVPVDGVYYYHKIRAVNGTTQSDYTAALGARTPLRTPSLTSATAASISQVNLAWTVPYSGGEPVPTGATSFNVYYSDDQVNFYYFAAVPGNQTTYTVANLPEGKGHYYAVAGSNGVVESSRSNMKYGASILRQPTNMAATTISSSQINLSWTDVPTTETGYKLYRRADNNGANTGVSLLATLPAGTVSYSDTGLWDGYRYSYTLEAYNNDTSSGQTAEFNAVTTMNLATSRAASSSGPGVITVQWYDNSLGEMFFDISRNGTYLDSLAGNTTSYTDNAAPDGVSVSYSVRGFNGYLYSTWSNLTPAVVTKLFAPTNVSASANFGTVTLNWTDNTANETGYEIRRSGALIATTSANTQSYSDTGRTDGTTYNYTVNAKNAAATSDQISTQATTQMRAPSSVSASVNSSTSVTVSWIDNSVSNTAQWVLRSENGGSFLQVATLNGTATSWTDTGLKDGSQYVYYIVATNSATSAFSADTNPVTTPLNAPTGYSSGASSPTNISIAWTDTSRSETAVNASYQINNGAWQSAFLAGANATQGWVNVQDASTYYGCVYFTNSYATSGKSNCQTVIMPPIAPSGMTATGGTGNVGTRWTDNSTRETSYQLFWCQGSGCSPSTQINLGASATAYTHSGRTKNITYCYKVRAMYNSTPSYDSITACAAAK